MSADRGTLVGAGGSSSCELANTELEECGDLSGGLESLFRLLEDDDRDIGSLKRELLLGVGIALGSINSCRGYKPVSGSASGAVVMTF